MNYFLQNITEKSNYETFNTLKQLYEKNCLIKLSCEKIHKIFKSNEVEQKRKFMHDFLCEFATKKRLFEFNCYQKISQARYPIRKNEFIGSPSPQKKFNQIYKIFKDQLDDQNFKHKLLKETDLNYFFCKRNSCNKIFTCLLLIKNKIFRFCFKKIFINALHSISPEELTGFKGFSKYSIILLPFKGFFFLNIYFFLNLNHE